MPYPSPCVAGFVFLEPEQGRVLWVARFQYNPDTLTRTPKPPPAEPSW
ncbi:hypothetical protein ABZ153_33330 [Streptomyces sp. NPDC006290]